MAKKNNPRNIPVSLADLKRAKQEAMNEAVTLAFAVMFSVLRDKHNASNEELQYFWREVEDLSESVSEGRVNCADLLHTLREEAGIFLED